MIVLHRPPATPELAEAVRSLLTIGGVYDYIAAAVHHQGGKP